MSEKYCPLKQIRGYCDEEKCAWYSNRIAGCVIAEIAIHLRIRTQDKHGREW